MVSRKSESLFPHISSPSAQRSSAAEWSRKLKPRILSFQNMTYDKGQTAIQERDQISRKYDSKLEPLSYHPPCFAQTVEHVSTCVPRSRLELEGHLKKPLRYKDVSRGMAHQSHSPNPIKATPNFSSNDNVTGFVQCVREHVITYSPWSQRGDIVLCIKMPASCIGTLSAAAISILS